MNVIYYDLPPFCLLSYYVILGQIDECYFLLFTSLLFTFILRDSAVFFSTSTLSCQKKQVQYAPEEYINGPTMQISWKQVLFYFKK